MKTVLLLGTGTGVGKTYVTMALAGALRRLAPSMPLLVWKPIETGTSPDASDPGSDHAQLGCFTCNISPEAPVHLFSTPVSPHLAARLDGVSIDVAEVARRIRSVTSASPAGLCLIETAGGVFTPLADRETNLSLALALAPSTWILVAPDSLGVLHDLGATLLALRAAARLPDHVVLSQARPPDPSTGTNLAELRHLALVPNPHLLPARQPESIEPLARALLTTANS